jgi:hypothetical protein
MKLLLIIISVLVLSACSYTTKIERREFDQNGRLVAVTTTSATWISDPYVYYTPQFREPKRQDAEMIRYY